MFYLVMRRILDISEASILALVAHMKAIKINKIVGEDVEEAVGTIKATLKVLTQCSTDVRNFVPDDIEVSVLQIFQTSSLDEFNEIFRRKEMNARAIADKPGGIPLYPTVQETCQQASNTYRHLTGPGDGYKWVKKPKQGVHFTPNGPTNARKCFNCGEPGCTPSTCDQPRDEERIKQAVEAYKKSLSNKPGAATGDNTQKSHDGNNSG